MHPLIVRLFQQRLDPSIVPLQSSYTVKVSKHPGDHAWDTGHALQEHASNEPFALVHWAIQPLSGVFSIFGAGRNGMVMTITCTEVHAPSKKPYHCEGYFIRPCLRFSVGDLNAVHLLLCVATGRPISSHSKRGMNGNGEDGTYTGWRHAGAVTLTFGALAGGGNALIFSCIRPVDENWRL